eukprot:TRINITY_DN24206_c0_g1_i1.p1 TRINITY_DN24206_c0_g1~~TRINITY_DN24206_c0_g1_i1.p1  ORF type:complete len:377 (-),score=61.86 TRINITY_DN24206_c0_g1_i1:52-1182(-)
MKKSTTLAPRLALRRHRPHLLPLRKKFIKSKGRSGNRTPLVSRRWLAHLPNWIGLHAERGAVRKCWEGHRLYVERQDGRRHGPCTRCGKTPKAGTPIMFCQSCSWGRCIDCCSNHPRLPVLSDDPLFHGPNFPCLLKPAFGEKALAGRGTVIICPGGNYEFLCPNEGMPVAAWLARNGIQALVLRYRLLPRHSFKEALSDLEEAIGNVRRWRNGPVAAIGFSAGGHLVASASRLLAKKGRSGSGPLDAQVLIYPAIDGEDWLDPEKSGFWDEACQSKAASLLEGQKALLGGAGFAAPPTFIVGSTGDAVCPPKAHSDPYVAELKKRKVLHTYLRGNFGEHGFGLVRSWTDRCLPWLQERGFGIPKQGACIRGEGIM